MSTFTVLKDNFPDVLLNIISRVFEEQKGQYSDLLKKFAITLHFYSAAAISV